MALTSAWASSLAVPEHCCWLRVGGCRKCPEWTSAEGRPGLSWRKNIVRNSISSENVRRRTQKKENRRCSGIKFNTALGNTPEPAEPRPFAAGGQCEARLLRAARRASSAGRCCGAGPAGRGGGRGERPVLGAPPGVRCSARPPAMNSLDQAEGECGRSERARSCFFGAPGAAGSAPRLPERAAPSLRSGTKRPREASAPSAPRSRRSSSAQTGELGRGSGASWASCARGGLCCAPGSRARGRACAEGLLPAGEEGVPRVAFAAAARLGPVKILSGCGSSLPAHGFSRFFQLLSPTRRCTEPRLLSHLKNATSNSPVLSGDTQWFGLQVLWSDSLQDVRTLNGVFSVRRLVGIFTMDQCSGISTEVGSVDRCR